MCQSCLKCLILLCRPVQSQSSIKCYWAPWSKHRPKILFLDWSSNKYVRGINQRDQPFSELVPSCMQVSAAIWSTGDETDVLYWVYISNDVELHQSVLPSEYHQVMLWMLYDNYLHQALNCTLGLVQERFYWSIIFQDVTEYVTNCQQCQSVKGHYTGPHTGVTYCQYSPGLVCIDVLEINSSKDSKEVMLVLIDAFSKFSQAFGTSKQKAVTITKILVDKWFCLWYSGSNP